MSPSVTFKSNVPATGEAPATSPDGAPLLRDAVRSAYAPSHGVAPSQMPPAPAGLQDLGPAGALRVLGPEREKWLQGMQSSDLASAPFGGAVAGAFLGGKGRLMAEGLLWRRPEEVLITTDPSRSEALKAHLDKLLIMEDCELADAPGLRRLRYWPSGDPPRVAESIAGSPQPLGFELLLPEDEAQALLRALPQRAAAEAMEAWRVALGVPAWGAELDEETTPIEAGLDRMLSFDKGCYVGQEVVAMATFRGRVAWNLVRLEIDGPAPQRGAPLGAGAKGRVTSAAQVGPRALLLGFVHKEQIVPGSEVKLGDGRVARVLGLPYGSKPGAGVCA